MNPIMEPEISLQDFASHPYPEPDESILLHLLNNLGMSKNSSKTETLLAEGPLLLGCHSTICI
jgi:hypothetical protein